MYRKRFVVKWWSPAPLVVISLGVGVTDREGDPLLEVPLSPSLTELRRGICVVLRSRGESWSMLDTRQPGTDCTSS